jgi:hypothetical protein
MGQCIEKKAKQEAKSISNDLKETSNYAIVDKTMLPKDLVGTIQNPTYVVNHHHHQRQELKKSTNHKNNLSKDRCNSSVYNYIDYDYEVVLNNNKFNKDKNDLNNNNRNKNIYKTITLDTSESSSNNTANDNENLIDQTKSLSKSNLNTSSAKKLMASNSIIIEITAL